jgi:hypothetical protein
MNQYFNQKVIIASETVIDNVIRVKIFNLGRSFANSSLWAESTNVPTPHASSIVQALPSPIVHHSEIVDA